MKMNDIKKLFFGIPKLFGKRYAPCLAIDGQYMIYPQSKSNQYEVLVNGRWLTMNWNIYSLKCLDNFDFDMFVSDFKKLSKDIKYKILTVWYRRFLMLANKPGLESKSKLEIAVSFQAEDRIKCFSSIEELMMQIDMNVVE